LRLAGELMEIRGADLHFTADEAEALMAAAGVAVGHDDVTRLRRTAVALGLMGAGSGLAMAPATEIMGSLRPQSRRPRRPAASSL
jgi:hypothetical protein